MKRILSMPFMGKRKTLLLALVSMAILALSGCSDASPAFGQFFSGRTLVISVVGIDRMSELRYTAAIRPTSEWRHRKKDWSWWWFT